MNSLDALNTPEIIPSQICPTSSVPPMQKRSRWFPVSTGDPEDAFRKTCLFGVFGWYSFHTNKKMIGLLYLPTCGLFGFGWLFDVLAFLIGHARDENGLRYHPLSNRKKGLLCFFVCIAAAVLLMMLYLQAFIWVSKLYAAVMMSCIPNGNFESLI
ncbi:MAG: TM2 domain-containing protein [Blautia sp.]|nr:TM2 domain-containing protein [Blautia sp.]